MNRAQFALFLQDQQLELVELRLEYAPGNRRALHRFEPERSAGEELDDAVVEVAGEVQPRPRFGGFGGGAQQRMALDMRRHAGRDLVAKIDMVEREVRRPIRGTSALCPYPPEQ